MDIMGITGTMDVMGIMACTHTHTQTHKSHTLAHTHMDDTDMSVLHTHAVMHACAGALNSRIPTAHPTTVTTLG